MRDLTTTMLELEGYELEGERTLTYGLGFESEAVDCQWVAATNADVARDGMVPRYRQLLGQPVGTEVVETHNGRLWKLKVISKASGLTTFAKDVRGWVCPAGGRPCALAVPEVLNRFGFDSDAVLPIHRPVIARIARCVAASSPRRVHFIRVVGHADPSGTHAYNMALGLRRARNVSLALQRAIDGIHPGTSRGIRFHVESHGDWEQVSPTAALDRRVEVYVALPAYAHPGCGGRGAPYSPGGGVLHEVHRAKSKPAVAVNRLVFFMNDGSKDAKHFENCATIEAKRIHALAQPTTNPGKRVGPTPFTSGKDILAEIAAAVPKVGAITRIHVFSHAGPRGIGGAGAGDCGLYMPQTLSPTTACGGRLLTDLPAGSFTDDVTFIFHGCRMAGSIAAIFPTPFDCKMTTPSDDNFCHALFQHLTTGVLDLTTGKMGPVPGLGLTNPQVVGHCASGCAGRNVDWREYSTTSPTGKLRPPFKSLYKDICCKGKPAPKDE